MRRTFLALAACLFPLAGGLAQASVTDAVTLGIGPGSAMSLTMHVIGIPAIDTKASPLTGPMYTSIEQDPKGTPIGIELLGSYADATLDYDWLVGPVDLKLSGAQFNLQTGPLPVAGGLYDPSSGVLQLQGGVLSSVLLGSALDFGLEPVAMGLSPGPLATLTMISNGDGTYKVSSVVSVSGVSPVLTDGMGFFCYVDFAGTLFMEGLLVPEPATWTMLCVGIAGIAAMRRWKVL